MSEVRTDFGPSLKDYSRSDWIAEVTELVEDDGSVSRLGKRHMAIFSEHGKTLLVSFETLQGIQALSPKAHPMGWKMAETHNWSSLTLVSDGDTWFRNPAVYAYFDHMVDDGFFDEFDRVLFYGAGSCGYAAAAFSVVAPGARVVVIQPQATLSNEFAEWDQRFTEMRRTDFSDRYGYAPDMLQAAKCAHIIYDPTQTEDAMHAALFSGPNIVKKRLRHWGSALQTDFLDLRILYDLLEYANNDLLSPTQFADLARMRRLHLPYLKRLLARLDAEERDYLARLLCHNVSARMRAPAFAARLAELRQEPA
ncbi:MAG: phosphoadenosine phosphosulfate reductase [Roseobacter sp.]